MKNAEVIADPQLSRVFQKNPVCEACWRQASIAHEGNPDPLSPPWLELLSSQQRAPAPGISLGLLWICSNSSMSLLCWTLMSVSCKDEGSDHSPLVSCSLDYIFLGLNALEEAEAPSMVWWEGCSYTWGQATQATGHEAAVPAPLCWDRHW